MSKKLYSKSDYESGNGMLTDIWGACQWHVLHTMSFNYPVHPTKENKKFYRLYVENLVNVLPCGKCRKNLAANFAKLPLKECHMKSRDTFSRYIYQLHEVVNQMLHKESGLSYAQVRDRYEQFRSRCTLTPYDQSTSKKSTTNKATPKTCKSAAKSAAVVSGTSGNKTRKSKPESGCTEPLLGEKQKCVLHIVPKTTRCNVFKIDQKCVKKRA